MSINNTNEVFHRNKMNNTTNETNRNYLNSSMTHHEYTIVNSQNSTEQHKLEQLNLYSSGLTRKHNSVKAFDEELHKNMFTEFKKIIADIESCVELLRVIQKDKPEMTESIQNLINQHTILLTTSESKEEVFKEFTSQFVRGTM